VTRNPRQDPDDPAVRRRLRRTAWTLVAVMAALAAGSACFIALEGHKSRTVLHSERMAADRPSTDRG
jgi:hypothetical protein